MTGTLVLLYHRVARLECDPHGLAVSPDRFAQHCEILRRFDVVPLREANRSTSRSARQVAITFDDGYADNAADARGILMAADLPATFFVTAGLLGERKEAWWDRLDQIFLACQTCRRELEIAIGGRPLWVDLRSLSARERARLAVFWRLRPMRPADIESALTDLEAQLDVRTIDRETYRWMTVEELRTLADTAGIDIGAHTLTHPLLATLEPKDQWTEIDGSRRSLERMLGTRTTLFSYPYGSRDAFDAVTTTLVREAGFTIACTVTGGIAQVGSDPLQIPRNVVGDWEGDVFSKWLDRWLRQH